MWARANDCLLGRMASSDDPDKDVFVVLYERSKKSFISFRMIVRFVRIFICRHVTILSDI